MEPPWICWNENEKTLKKFNVLQVFPQTNPNISKYGVPGRYT
jgi:hypothetical protein